MDQPAQPAASTAIVSVKQEGILQGRQRPKNPSELKQTQHRKGKSTMTLPNPSRIRPLLLLTVVLAMGGLTLFLGALNAVSAQPSCPQTYVVRRGDTLSHIAQRFGLTLRQIIELNREQIRNPDLLRVGWTLCVAPPVRLRFSLESTYLYSPTNDELVLSRATEDGGLIGMRVELPLAPISPVVTAGLTETLVNSLTGTSPVLIGVRDGNNVDDYILVAVGQPALLQALLISATDQLTLPTRVCSFIPVQSALGSPAVLDLKVVAHLESPAGVRYPFPIGQIGLVPDAVWARRCYGGMGVRFFLELVDDGAGGGEPAYRLNILLNEEGFGPPRYGSGISCRRWSGRSGWYYRWIYNVFC